MTDGFGNVVATGVVYNGIAVFDFNSINLPILFFDIATGPLPLALLSRSDAVIAGFLNVGGENAARPGRPRRRCRRKQLGGGGGPGGGDLGVILFFPCLAPAEADTSAREGAGAARAAFREARVVARTAATWQHNFKAAAGEGPQVTRMAAVVVARSSSSLLAL